MILSPKAPERPFALSGAHSLEVRDGETFLVDSFYYDVVFGLDGVLDMPPTDIPTVVRPLLLEFETLYEEPVKGDVPPLRGIRYNVDFVPGFPNLPHYRMAPGEHVELHRQVMILFSKGIGRESNSLV